jgi:hypothetical protein
VAGLAVWLAFIAVTPAAAQGSRSDAAVPKQVPLASSSMRVGSITVAYSGAPPLNADNSILLPQQKTFLAAYVAYNDACEEVSEGSWTDDTSPTYGEPGYGTVTGHLINGDCADYTFTGAAIYYTWTNAATGAQTDSFSATWSGAGATVPQTFNLMLASVKITNTSNINDGAVVVTINAPADATGDVVVTFNGKKKTASQTATNLSSGDTTLDLALADIDPDTYTSATATWTPKNTPINSAKYTLPKKWVYLRLIRYSQYNTPYENLCSGGDQAMYIFNRSGCSYVQGTLDSEFVSQTKINGTGSSIDYGLLKPLGATDAGSRCSGHLPPHASSDNTFVRVPTVTGSCNTLITANHSVATNPNPTGKTSLLQCGNSLTLVQASPTPFASRVVADLCPACDGLFSGTNGHIDSYTANHACQGHGEIGDLGKFYTSHLK